jgi:oxygen-independent coproporphyrinogen-3 oxidase
MDTMVNMIIKELELQKNYLGEKVPIRTVYLGGGTPSLLGRSQLEIILNTLHKHYTLELDELTIETNPDDLDREKLGFLKGLGIDRLSIGVQSFDQRVLQFYNRVHNAQESLQAINKAKEAGFEKLSIDLIYGYPHSSHDLWKKDLEMALTLDPGHISSYGLTIEPDTALGRWTRKGIFVPATEDYMAEQFEWMQDEMEKAGYIQYEISNFGKKGAFAVHNTNYWKGIPYLGIGPSAHSFNGTSRQHNISHNGKYINSLESGTLLFDLEELGVLDGLNEYLLTSLRTIWGADLGHIQNHFKRDILEEKSREIELLIQEGLMLMEGNTLTLTKKGKLLADGIALKIFF